MRTVSRKNNFYSHTKSIALVNRIAVIFMLAIFSFGCQDASAPIPEQPVPSAARLISAQFNDIDDSYHESQGDTIILSFDLDVSLDVIYSQALTELTAPVTGDRFGDNAMVQTGPDSNQLILTLGSDPELKLTGSFDASRLNAGSPSGISIPDNSHIITTRNGLSANGSVNIDSTLTTGFVINSFLNEARGLHTSTLLDDGRILVVGGWPSNGNFAFSNEILTDTSDPGLGGAGGSMIASDNGNSYFIGRYGHTATKLNDGTVLIAGGYGFEAKFDGTGNPIISELNSAFIFDPDNNEFLPTSTDIAIPRLNHYSVLMPDGQVLLAGGYNSTANNGQGGTIPLVELYNPVTREFTQLNEQMDLPRERGSATLLDDGNVLFIGGQALAIIPPSPNVDLFFMPGSSLYQIDTGGYAGPVTDPNTMHASVSLNNDFYIIGGNNTIGSVKTIIRFNQGTGNFENAGSLQTARVRNEAALVDGKILVTGGIDYSYSLGVASPIFTAELYDPQTQYITSYPVATDRNSFTVLSLPNDRVIVIGGFSGGVDLTGIDGIAISGTEMFVVP